MNYLTPTYALAPTFLGVTNTDPGSEMCVVGVPFDLATTFRSGARMGPEAIRAASRMLYDGQHPLHHLNPLDIVTLADAGNFVLPLGQLEKSIQMIGEKAVPFRHLIALGGDHMISFGLLKAAAAKHGPLGLVHFDAHTDCNPDSFGEPWGHGCVFRRALEHGFIDPHRMVQIGVRATLDITVLDWLHAQGVTIISAEDVHLSRPETIARRILAITGTTHPTYLTFDIDALDPGQAPGTGTPEIGGLFTWQAQSIIRKLVAVNFIGMDVTEVAPAYDHAEITALAAATLAYEYLCLIAKKKAAGKT